MKKNSNNFLDFSDSNFLDTLLQASKSTIWSINENDGIPLKLNDRFFYDPFGLTLDISPNIGVCIEKYNGEREIVFNFQDEHRIYRLENPVRIDEIFPLKDKQVEVEIIQNIDKSKILSSRLVIRYGFPKIINHHNVLQVDPESVISLYKFGNYNDMLTLLFKGLRIGLNSSGYEIMEFNNHRIRMRQSQKKSGVIHAEKHPDLPYQTNNPPIKKRHKIYTNSFYSTTTRIIRRNRNFSLQMNFYNQRSSINEQRESKTIESRDIAHEIENTITEIINWIFSEVYNYQVVKLLIVTDHKT